MQSGPSNQPGAAVGSLAFKLSLSRRSGRRALHAVEYDYTLTTPRAAVGLFGFEPLLSIESSRRASHEHHCTRGSCRRDRPRGWSVDDSRRHWWCYYNSMQYRSVTAGLRSFGSCNPMSR